MAAEDATDIETITVARKDVDCDGGALGHPKVYLNLGEDGEIACPYCGRRFVLKADCVSDGG
ncbi:MAG: zinc-finger domain-containing protein [Proteobacteria bacterium]|nr:zinc-finger domain-containing protein [Pseudomonadota bacterium]